MARILIVDDEEPIRSFLRRGLELDGHAVATADDGATALEALTQANGAFDLVLTDIRMPVMDGIALALAVRRDWPAIVIVLMTGYADQRERARGLDAIVSEVLTKPFALADVRDLVRKLLS